MCMCTYQPMYEFAKLSSSLLGGETEAAPHNSCKGKRIIKNPDF